ncbi:unnamed protein product [Urochloa humidicola]
MAASVRASSDDVATCDGVAVVVAVDDDGEEGAAEVGGTTIDESTDAVVAPVLKLGCIAMGGPARPEATFAVVTTVQAAGLGFDD